MTPATLAKSGSEHGHQTALFAYLAVARLHGWDIADAWADGWKLEDAKAGLNIVPIPALDWIHAIHNQGHGDRIRGANAKAEGVRKGIADIFLPWPVAAWHGLYIEMKKPAERPKKETSKGGVSDEQQSFGTYSKNVGYGWIVCYSWEDAVSAIRSYIEWGKK